MHDGWNLTIAALLGQPWPALPDLPGRLIVCADEPLADEYVRLIEDPRELATVLGISRTAAAERLRVGATNEGRQAEAKDLT